MTFLVAASKKEFMGYAKIDDGSLYFEIYGEGQPLVLICGITGSIDFYWHTVLQDLQTKFQVITFDTRGAGKTEYSQKSFTIDQLADDVSHLLDHLGIEKASVLGHSMGSAIAQTFAHKHPNRLSSMILCNTFPRLNHKDQLMISSILGLLDEDVPLKKIFWTFMPWIYSDHFLSDEQRREKVLEFYANRHIERIGFKQQAEALLMFDSRSWLDQVKADTLVISSSDDIMFPPELGNTMAEQIPKAKYIELSGGHAVHVEQSSKLTSLITDFIRPN